MEKEKKQPLSKEQIEKLKSIDKAKQKAVENGKIIKK